VEKEWASQLCPDHEVKLLVWNVKTLRSEKWATKIPVLKLLTLC
jgi:hypothetical protein